MTRSDAYAVLGFRFASEVEKDPALLAVALQTAEQKGDQFKAGALAALRGV
jgi:hypothetical protein